MTLDQVIFLITSVVILVSAVLVVTVPKMIHAALWLILALAGIAVIFVLLQAPFFAVVQVIVYIGAIAVLVIFAVMLTRKAMTDSGAQSNKYISLAAIVCLALFGGLIYMIFSWNGAQTIIADAAPPVDAVINLGVALVAPDGYLLPFELASILLLAALIGAIYIGRERSSGESEK
jgi:NADH-quinone oxidoreductase subunit J